MNNDLNSNNIDQKNIDKVAKAKSNNSKHSKKSFLER